MPYYLSTYRRAAAILAGGRHTIEGLPVEARAHAFDCRDVGFDDCPVPFDRPSSSRMTVLFVGRLVPYKCADVLVRAFAHSSRLRQHRLVIVGDGPDRPLLEGLIAEHGLADCVELTGHRPHDEVMRWMGRADVFAFPTIRELGAGVVIEAMGMGLACVVADYGAPGVYVADGRGLAIPLVNKPALIDGYIGALESLADDPRRRAALGASARQYVRDHHTWDAKARKIVQVYEWVLGRRRERPDFYRVEEPLVERS